MTSGSLRAKSRLPDAPSAQSLPNGPSFRPLPASEARRVSSLRVASSIPASSLSASPSRSVNSSPFFACPPPSLVSYKKNNFEDGTGTARALSTETVTLAGVTRK